MSASAVHLLIVGLITLLVFGLCIALFWHLWLGKGKHHATRKQPPTMPIKPITPDMVKQKLAQIDLDLSTPSGDDKPA